MARKVTPPTRHEGAATLEEPLTAAYEKILESRRRKSLTDEASPPQQEVITPSPNTEKPRNGAIKGFTGNHAESIASERPQFRPIPEGLAIEREFKKGIRVLRSDDATIVAVQFAENRTPNRAEKDILEALGQPDDVKFTYQPKDKIWTREGYEHTADNMRDAIGMAGRMAEGRGRGR